LVKGLVPMGPPAWIVAALPLLASFYTLRAYLKYLREADELQRRVQLEALGLGFGAGVLFMMGYRLFERIGAPKLDMNAALFVMLLTWAFAQAWIARRYR
jgi:hypothetical protein